jgi:hypothetical protein
MRDYREGECPELALPLELGSNVLVDATAEFPKWYYINLEPGLFKVTSVSGTDYFACELYHSDNTDYQLTESQAMLDNGLYELRYNINEEARYYLRFTFSWDETCVLVEGSIATEIDTLPVAGEKSISLNGRTLQSATTATVYDMSGKVVGRLGGNAMQGITLERGVYVVKTAGETLKVLVK